MDRCDFDDRSILSEIQNVERKVREVSDKLDIALELLRQLAAKDPKIR